MGGELAALFLAFSLWDMSANFCQTGCLGVSDQQDRMSISAGQIFLNEDEIGTELYLRRDLGLAFGPYQPSLGVSITDRGAGWIGLGFQYTTDLPLSGSYAQFHLMPGLYARGGGADLGSVLQFRSGIEIGYEAPSGVRYGLSFDHRSNADTASFNPGLETFQFRISLPKR